MPKTKPLTKDPFESFLILIRGTMVVKGETADTISAKTNINRQTFYAPLRNPHDFRVSELQGVSKALGIPWSELRDKLPEKSC
ncbi:MAG: hypothetical protein FWH20_00375 [Oscillospiraceae bacterium]|nr:hypothetical protein [Oscillospiraceae bacterium]